MKTELEKRWEDEDDEEERTQESVISEYESIQSDIERLMIINPLVEGFSPMVLIDVGMRRVLGGLMDRDHTTHSCSLTYPMEYIEQRVPTGRQDPSGMPYYETKIGVLPMYAPFGAVEYVDFVYSSMYFLMKNNSDCLGLVNLYKSTIDSIKASKAGISRPTDEEVKRISSEKA